MAVLANSSQTIWSNQQELSKTVTLLDEQFAVSTRMSVMGINSLLKRVQANERIDEADIESLFEDWAKFKKRPDYRNYIMEWFLGVDITTLPPPPQAEEVKKEGEQNAQSDRGDPSPSEELPQDSSPGQKDDVSQVPPQDGATDGP